MDLKKIVTKFREYIKVGDIVYYVDYRLYGPQVASIELVLQEVKVGKINDYKNLEIFGDYKLLSKLLFADLVEVARESKYIDKKQYSDGFFYEKSKKRFYTNKAEAQEHFKKRFKSLLMRKETIKAIFKGTGHTYGNGDKFVGYKLVLFNVPGVNRS